MTDYNVDLLMQVREKIVNEPEKHYQALWARAQSDPREGGDCGTAYCVAGWAAVLDGQKLAWEQDDDSGAWEACWLEDDRAGSIHSYAREALGLKTYEAMALFSGSSTRALVLQHLDALIDAGKNGERAVLR